MSIELAGISNVNEFYSEHYLQTVFEGDVQELRSQWRAAEKVGEAPPDRLLVKAGVLWRRLVSDYKSERNDRARLLIFREFAHEFLQALSYERRFRLVPDAEEKLLPVTASRTDASGHDRIWVLETVSPRDEDFEAGPLALRFRCEQFENIDAAADIEKRRKDTAEVAINKGVFALKHPPRFVILLSMAHAVLIDREKWSDSRLLSFDFAEIFGRGDFTTVGAVAALLNATSLAPDSGTALIDRIDEESHRHAYGVSQDLKYSLREAIELLGNEAASLIVEKRRAQQKGVFSGESALDATVLSAECLRYMYRLLFVLYIEARPQLGFAPINAEAYAKGYSLESLRDLALIPLETDEDRNGHYISDTIDTLFRIVFEGTPAAGSPTQAAQEVFTFAPVRARLFDPDAVATYLKGLRFRNSVMQRIIELLSLSRESRGRNRGRISYVNLGISQLGAVYESLLSFTGFFAKEDLIELKPAGESNAGPLEAAYFAPRSRSPEFEKTGEIVFEGNTAKIYPKGTFIYRLSGRNRENSASYYTPEPLARVLVKYALKDLLEGKKADDILQLKVIEPAMGSAAFLVEVVNQLTDKYLELKQEELGRRIPHEERADVERRVRAYIADRNVFGVDLNPIAVELGQISLWLNCLHKGGHAPWFDDQVHNGNSLVGARRAVFPVASLSARREDDRWHKRKPREIGWSGDARKEDEVWHFLLPDPGMSAYDQKIVRPLAPDAWRGLAGWRRDFTQPFDDVEIKNLRRVSEAIDVLFEDVANRLEEVRRSVNNEIGIWPQMPADEERHIDFKQKVKKLAGFHGKDLKNAVSWRRLRTAMDAWCALWFWPVEKIDLLPPRATFLADISLVLEGKMGGRVPTNSEFCVAPAQGCLFETISVSAKAGSQRLFDTEDRAKVLEKNELLGDVDIEKLIAASTWLPTAMETAKKLHFMHYDLEFADVLRERGGFDLVIGNPPWLKPTWLDPLVLSEILPEISLRGYNAARVEDVKQSLLTNSPELCRWYMDSYVPVAGIQTFLSSTCNYPILNGGSPNLYQCFVESSFRLVRRSGIAAFIHKDSHLLEPRLQSFRDACFKRLIMHFSFRNELYKKMFAEVNHSEMYSANIYRGWEGPVGFDHISGLFLPSTIDECYEHDGVGPVPGIRLGDAWDVRGHRKRLVRVDDDTLALMAALTRDPDSGSLGRFVYPHSTDILSVMRSLSVAPQIGVSVAGRFQMSPMWHEGMATKQKRLMKIGGTFVPQIDDLIIKSPCIYVGNPFYKTPDEGCSAKEEFEEIDLEAIPDDYIPRTNLQRIASKAEVYSQSTAVSWSLTEKHCDHFRIAVRGMVQPARERTLAAALIPPGIQHIDAVESISFEDERDLVCVYPLLLSLTHDFLIKAMQVEKIRESVLRYLPFARVPDTAKHRALRLACLTSHYAEFWNRHAKSLEASDWSSQDNRLRLETPHRNLGEWNREVGLRSEFARRLALIEIDVLVAQAFGLTEDELIMVYRSQFPVLEENENNTWYDNKGRIVWTCSKGLTTVGWFKPNGRKPNAEEWKRDYAELSGGQTLQCLVKTDFLPGGERESIRSFEAPFSICDREADYRRAWAFFEAQSQQRAA